MEEREQEWIYSFKKAVKTHRPKKQSKEEIKKIIPLPRIKSWNMNDF